MLKVAVISQQQNDTKYWQELFSGVWEGPVEISVQNNYQIKKDVSLVIVDFSGIKSGANGLLTEISPNLVGKHFLMVSDAKDADLAIEGIKLGAIGFLVKPFKRFELISCLDRLHTAPVGRLATTRKAKIVTLLSYKGGTGVSTVTANLGYTLSHVYQKKTLIIDGAGFSNHITVLLNAMPKCTLADVCKQGMGLDEGYLTNAVTMMGKNLAIIGGLIKTTDMAEVNTMALERLIEIATEIYDFILVDTSTHMLDETTLFFIQKSSELLLLTTFDLLAIRDNRFYIQALKELGVPEYKIKAVINRQDWYIGSLEPQLVQKQINHNIYHTLPNDWNLCVEAANYGRPFLEVSPNAALSTSLKILAGKLSKMDVPEQTPEQEQKETNASGEEKDKKEKKEKKKGLLSF